MTTVESFRAAEDALIRLDPVLGALVEAQRPIMHQPQGDYFTALCRSIIAQQVSVAAATTIFARFQAATGLDPRAVRGLTPEQARSLGLSRQKAGYLHDLADHFMTNPAVYDHLDTLSDADAIIELTAVKGIGVWTAQMFLMFSLLRPDVFAPDDAGLQRAMKQLYRWDAIPDKATLVATADRWRPYRTVACWHLWQSLDNAPN